MRGYTAIAGWVADVPSGILTDLYLRAGALPVGPPSKSTIRLVSTDADAHALDVAVGTWFTSIAATHASTLDTGGHDETPPRGTRVQIRLDGKTMRGAKDHDGNQMQLLAALAGWPATAPRR
jgi:hypothetical protein